jgi:nitrile hydratase
MGNFPHDASDRLAGIVLATGEAPLFRAGEAVRVMTRSPVGHYRVPTYLRMVESVIGPAAIDNEEGAYGRNAGSKPPMAAPPARNSASASTTTPS